MNRFRRAVSRWLERWRGRRQNVRPPAPGDLHAIRRTLRGEQPRSDSAVRRAQELADRSWPGFEMRKRLSAFAFMENVAGNLEFRPRRENSAAWKMIYEARLEILKDPRLSHVQKILGMSGTDKRVALEAIAANDADLFNVCVVNQMAHVKKRIEQQKK